MNGRYLLVCVLVVSVGACSLRSPAARINAIAEENGYFRIVLKGDPFSHIAFVKQSSYFSGELHVYIEGDGVPWVKRRWIAPDPTSRNALMLRLMAMDQQSSIYLGRPCYMGLQETPPCKPAFWTSARYSEPVVNSMATVLKKFIEGSSNSRITFMGHSGGGALAMLLAHRIPQTVAVVTLAANLDIDAWTNYHRYSPLTGSLNPANQPPLPAYIRQWHFAGSDDNNIPLSSIKAEVIRQPNASLRILKGHDHRCCWEEDWPSILSILGK